MPIATIGYVVEKTTKKGNRVLMGDVEIEGGKHRIMVTLKRTKNNSFAVGLLTDDEEQEKKASKEPKDSGELEF